MTATGAGRHEIDVKDLHRDAGGEADLELFEGEAAGLISRSRAPAARAIGKIADFVPAQLG